MVYSLTLMVTVMVLDVAKQTYFLRVKTLTIVKEIHSDETLDVSKDISDVTSPLLMISLEVPNILWK